MQREYKEGKLDDRMMKQIPSELGYRSLADQLFASAFDSIDKYSYDILINFVQ